jgi:hypothetical protein
MTIDDFKHPYGIEFHDTPENRKFLADKVLSTDDFCPLEKEFLYRLIVPCKKKRGRDNEFDRNKKLALADEQLKTQGIKFTERRKILGNQLELTGRADVSPRTYFASLKIGRALLTLDREYEEELASRRKLKKERLM